MADLSVIQRIVDAPSEALNIELKTWIDPNTPDGSAKIVRATFAVRNRNGGFVAIGFNNKTLQPDPVVSSQEVFSQFHQDAIQGIVSKYASEPFEVEVAWGSRENKQFPIIVVPAGVKTPVAAKRDIVVGDKILVKTDAVYFRSLNSNGTASSTEIKYKDWPELIQICLDNREADIGRFIRRHIAEADLDAFVAALFQSSEHVKRPTPLRPNETSAPLSIITAALTSQCEPTRALVDEGLARFNTAVEARTLTVEERELLNFGFLSVALSVQPPREDEIADRRFYSTIASSNPNYTAWPVWLDPGNFSAEQNRPIVVDNAYQYLIFSMVGGFSNHVDFARFEPSGRFFLNRLLQDDSVPERVKPLTVLDPLLMSSRITEVIAVGLTLIKALGWQPDATLAFAFRWSKLKDRQLQSWSDDLFFSPFDGGVAHDDTIDSCIEVPLETPLSALAPYVHKATKRLFAAFSGAVLLESTIEDSVKKFLKR